VRVVYVMTKIMGDQRYFSWHILPDIAYWRLQRSVIELCCRSPRVQLTAKLFPGEARTNPLESWIREQGFENCRIVRDRPFTEVMAGADLLIVDNPATTLLQALSTRARVITFAEAPFMRFFPEAAALLERRARVATSKADLLRAIEEALVELEAGGEAPLGDEFLRSFGTHEGDGRSAERAAAAIGAVVARRPGPCL
jgi:hypothetical protein